MNYYKLVTLDEGHNVMMSRTSHRRIFTTAGTRIDPSTINTPFEIDLHVGEDYGYDQYDPFFEGEIKELTLEERLSDYYGLPCVMSAALLQAVQSTGVENLQVFPTRITHADTEEELEQEYFFVNIVGLVACADLEGSEKDPLGSTFHFHELKLHPEKTGGLSIFRLAESPSTVIVNEDIANVIRNGGFAGVGLEPVTS